jgi:hypothetical protein
MVRIGKLDDEDETEPEPQHNSETDSNLDSEALDEAHTVTQGSKGDFVRLVCGCVWTDASFFVMHPGCKAFDCLETYASQLSLFSTSMETSPHPPEGSKPSGSTVARPVLSLLMGTTPRYLPPWSIIAQPAHVDSGVAR